MGIFAWIGLGVLAAVITKLLTPRRIPANWGVYLCYGVAGGVVGGWIAARIYGIGEFLNPGFASSLGSILGAIVLLWVAGFNAARRQSSPLVVREGEPKRETRRAA